MGEVLGALLNIWNLIKDMIWQISVVILIVIVCRVFVQKISKQACYFLWLIVAVRLLVPVMIPSSFSVFNWMEKPQLEQINNEKTDPSISGTTDVSINEHEDISNEQLKQETIGNTQISEVHQTNPEPTIQDSNYSHMLDIAAEDENTTVIKDTVKNWDFILWIAGMNLMLIYGIFSYVFLKHKLRFATKNPNGFMECENISSPFVFGIIKPVIYLPYHLNEQEQNYILSHERYHIRRRDYLVKLFAFALLTVYWFHPLVWVAFYLMSQDMEASCDEQVLKDFGIEDRKAYSSLLLSFASNKRYPLTSPLSFGENDVKSRIKQILNYKKPTFWGIVAVVVITIIVAVCCLTDAKSKNLKLETEMIEDEILAFAEKLYDAKNPYIGDVYADRTIMSLLLEELGVTGFSGNEIQTYEEPYWISFSFDEEPNDNRMWQASAMFMALVDNAKEVRWTFYDEYEELKTYYVTVDSVNQYLEGNSLKDFAVSSEKLAELWNMLDEKRTYAVFASGEYKSILVSTSNWEHQAKKAGLDFTERITWENRLRDDGIGYRGDDGYVAGCQYQDFDRNGMTDFAITIIEHQREDNVDSCLYIYMNDDPVYIYNFSIHAAFWNLQTADIDGDGYLEFIFSGDSGGTGGYGFNAFFAILKYKNHSFEEILLPTDEYLEWTEESHAGIGVEIYATDKKDTFEAYCPLIKESVSFSFVSENNPFNLQNYEKGDLVGREYYGFDSLSIVERNGKTYLLGKEALYCENLDEWHGIEIMGYATFLLSWGDRYGWKVEDYQVFSLNEISYFESIAQVLSVNWQTMRQGCRVFDLWWKRSEASATLKGKYEDKIFTFYRNENTYEIDLSKELASSDKWEWQVAGIFTDIGVSKKTYICLTDFDVASDGSETRDPGLLLIEFDPDTPEDYHISSYQGSYVWYDNCYMLGETLYFQDENSLRAINVITKELYDYENEYEFIKEYVSKTFRDGYHCYLLNAAQEKNDVIIYEVMVSKDVDMPPVGMVFVACKDKIPIGYMCVDFTADNYINGTRVEMIK